MSVSSPSPSPSSPSTPRTRSRLSRLGTENNIKVVCRIRPANDAEIRRGGTLLSVELETVVSVRSKEPGLALDFDFDRVFPEESSQDDVYNESVRHTVEDFVQGYNGTILAYGQTGSGKSYTMMGPLNNSETQLRGMIPRISETIFENCRKTPELTYNILVSFMEIYMEQIHDLLDPYSGTDHTRFLIQEDKNEGIYVRGLTEKSVSSPQDLESLLHEGLAIRTMSSTQMNADSSRSHAIFQIKLRLVSPTKKSTIKSSLFLVDLAGSEKVNKTGATGHSLEEAKKINSSLSRLGTVIYALTDGKSAHIPYRDSKLTRILQEALGGNSRTTLIVTCSPSTMNENETISTLRFGARAKNIRNVAHINMELSPSQMKERMEQLEIDNRVQSVYISRLEQELGQWRQGYGGASLQSSESDEIALRDNKIAELENTVLTMKMESLKVAHEEELKMFKLENTLRRLNDKLSDIELINLNLRKHLIITEKLIEARDNRINKLEHFIANQRVQVQTESESFESKLAHLKEKIDAHEETIPIG